MPPEPATTNDATLSLHRLRLSRLAQDLAATPTSAARRAALAREWRNQWAMHLALIRALEDLDLRDLPSFQATRDRCNLVSRLLDGPTSPAQLALAVEIIRGLIDREERPETGLLARARAQGISDSTLRRHIAARLAELDCPAAPQRHGNQHLRDAGRSRVDGWGRMAAHR